MQRWWWNWAAGLAGCLVAAPVAWAAPADAIRTIRAVGPKGEGHAAAIAAVKELSAGKPELLPTILAGFDGASPLAANWLRSAFETVADRALKNQQLPAQALEAFAQDRNRDAAARRMAYEWLLKVDPAARDRLIPGMLQDPSAEFRRDAVAVRLAAAEKLLADGQKPDAIAAFREALQGAVDDDQVKAIVKPLRELGETVDLQKHFGFLTEWQLIGPFDNVDLKGFDAVYPPEEKLDFSAKYAGQLGEVSWQPYATPQEYGMVDLTKALAPHKGAVVYAATQFDCDRDQAVEIRLGTPNAWKLWVNGKLAFARDEYHRGNQLDQYRVRVQFRRGANSILLKVCQNEQKEDWAQKWEYQLRVCDSAGAAIAPTGAKTSARETTAPSRLAQGAR